MIRILLMILFCAVISGCGSSYHYYSPPVNCNPFAGKNEIHFSGMAGITGSAAKLGYAITDNLAISGTYHLSTPLKYHGSEFETGIMWAKQDSLSTRKILTLGCGFGNNYEQKPEAMLKNFRGDFVKPFAMLTLGSADRTASLGDIIFVDGSVSIKANYMIYNGYKATTINNISTEKKFNTNVFFVEPYFNFNVGLKWFRLDLGMGIILKKKYMFDKNLAVFPVEANAGVLYILGRKSMEKKQTD